MCSSADLPSKTVDSGAFAFFCGRVRQDGLGLSQIAATYHKHIGEARVANVVADCCNEEGKKIHVGQFESEMTISAKPVRFPCVSIPAQNGGRWDGAGST